MLYFTYTYTYVCVCVCVCVCVYNQFVFKMQPLSFDFIYWDQREHLQSAYIKNKS